MIFFVGRLTWVKGIDMLAMAMPIILREVPDGAVDLVVTDPPFAIDFRSQRNNYHYEDYLDNCDLIFVPDTMCGSLVEWLKAHDYPVAGAGLFAIARGLQCRHRHLCVPCHG
jgi:glycosyltransferase involved in cell wall biosynthesis